MEVKDWQTVLADKETPEIQFMINEKYDLEKVVKENQAKVYNVCLSILQNPQDAEDISQDVFIHLLGKIDQFKDQSVLTTWIYRIAVNKCLEELRKRKRKKRWGVLISFGGNYDENEQDVPHFDHPGILLENKERAAVLFYQIDKLPNQQKVAFTLQKIEGLSYEEISKIMDTSISAVESLIHRARQNLKNKLTLYYQKEWI